LSQNRVTSLKDDPQTTPTHAVYVKADAEQNFRTPEILSIILNRGGEKPLARPERKQANVSVRMG